MFAKPKDWQIHSNWALIGPRGRSPYQIFLHTYLWFVIFSTLAESVLQKSKKNESRLGQGEGRCIKSFFILTYDLSFLARWQTTSSKKLKRKLGRGVLGPLLKSISSFQFLHWSLIKHHSDNKHNQTRSISISVFAVSNNETRSTSTSRPFCSMLFGGRRTKSIVYS